MNNLWCTNYSSVRTNTRFTVPFGDIDDHSISYKLYGSSNEEIEVLAASETSDCPCQTVVTD